MSSVDSAEIKKFSELSHQWWDESGGFRALHDLNPLRLQYISRFVTLTNKQVLDVGCGGGILAEGMTSLGAVVTGIDPSSAAIRAARRHCFKKAPQPFYCCTSIESFVHKKSFFDAVVCMEMLEHTDQPLSIVRACIDYVKPKGWVFFSTINRNPIAYLGGVLVAEYILRLVPRGTHSYARFIKPSELIDMIEQEHKLELIHLTGVSYNPFLRQGYFSPNPSINYMVALQKI